MDTQLFAITVVSGNHRYWLRGTTWTAFGERADTFPTHEHAEVAAKKAEKFMAPSIRRNYKIEVCV